MAYNNSPRKAQTTNYSPPRSSPLRNFSNASTDSSAYSGSGYSDPFMPSRTSTISSAASSGYQPPTRHKRGASEAGMPPIATNGQYVGSREPSPTKAYRNVRESLRPLPQPPSSSSPPPVFRLPDSTAESRHHRDDLRKSRQNETSDMRKPSPDPVSPSQNNRLSVLGLSRSDSVARRSAGQHVHGTPGAALLSSPDLHDLQKSSTGHLRALSRFAGSEHSSEFSITSPAPSVAGLHGRRQLKRNDSYRGGPGLKPQGTSTWTGAKWMDQQRQFLQAYEYLCHIGEAKEWIEDVIQKDIPPIVHLEEALRNGVTLAEIVQTFKPHRNLRIIRDPKLQFKHSDNINLFFRFLDEVELPDLFRFELIDLYEKKNIPKVIYCVHALSWLLYRNGMVSFRIGNLVGQLQFEHHELETVQKGLDKAGINMPSFSGMGASFGAEPEPEPVETEQERQQRELSEHEAAIIELQAQVRGSIIRAQLGEMMQEFWDAEGWIVDLQSRTRGDFVREISGYRLMMRSFAVNLQSATRGYLMRHGQHRKEASWRGQEGKVILLQSLARARRSREQTQHIKVQAKKHESGIRQLQASIRGVLERRRFDSQHEQAQLSQGHLPKLQAHIRGMLLRHAHDQQKAQMRQSSPSITGIQAVIRGMAQRSVQAHQAGQLRDMNGLWRVLQSVARGKLERSEIQELRRRLGQHAPQTARLQAQLRGRTLRDEIGDLKTELLQNSSSVISIQAATRGYLLRAEQDADHRDLVSQSSNIARLQALARANLLRQDVAGLLGDLEIMSAGVIHLQALTRAMLVRADVGSLLNQLEDVEPNVEELQAAIRGKLVRSRFAEKKRFYKQNMEKVVKLQSFVRAKMQGQAYKSLTEGKNPPVGTVKNFVHLLNDSDFDFEEELESERLRKTVVQHVRQNETADQYIQQLDIKIALLVKNKITLDEVVKHQKHFGGSVNGMLTNRDLSGKDQLDLKALNKNSRRKLEQYQELFFILQTQPQYLARLFRRIREQATAEKECERIRHLTMGLFGYAQKRREEYYLLRLLTRSIKEEVDSCNSLQEYLRGNFFWSRVFNTYVKSPRDRKYMRDAFGPLVKESILDNPELDLESDPMQIYLTAIEHEQLRTGDRSERRPDIPREEAIRDPETKRLFIAHLQDLRDIADQFFVSLEESLPRMPYGIRFIAQQMFHSLTARFRREQPATILQAVGQWLWKAYLQPALQDPDKAGVVDRGLVPEHKRNLAEVVKVIGQVASAKLFGQENVFLQPLNSYVNESIPRLSDIWNMAIDVPDAETRFDIDEFNDLYAKTKPTLYTKMSDIFAIHQLVAKDTAYLTQGHEDLLRDIVRELGNAKTNETELGGVSSSEICLTLNPKLHDVEDPETEVKALFMETKRCVLYIIRVQSGTSLIEIMVKPVTPDDDARWATLVRDELSAHSRKRGAYAEANTILDIASMAYAELKTTALENIVRLEAMGRLSRQNNWQDILNAIAIDIRTKHRRRIQRQREIEGTRLTLARLDDQAVYLEQQLKTYNDYIEQAMVTLQNKKGKKRFLMPFSKQWEHERELQRTGRTPKFGSYKYSAQELSNRGVLVSWQGFSERELYSLDLTMSSNEVGIFNIEGSSGNIAIPGANAEVPLDDLLQAQYNNTQHLEFFGADGKIKVNVNMFLHLIMKKFYKDRDN